MKFKRKNYFKFAELLPFENSGIENLQESTVSLSSIIYLLLKLVSEIFMKGEYRYLMKHGQLIGVKM